MLGGLRTALSWLTVLPVRGATEVDRAVGRSVIVTAPVVGALLGAVMAATAYGAAALGLPSMAVGLLAVAVHAVSTRGMHLDGLSDTTDGLGCYGDPERAREVMKSGGAGPFGVAALTLVLGLQAATIGTLAAEHRLAPIVVAATVARVAVVIACRHGTPPAADTGFGALVAGTVSPLPVLAWFALAMVAAGAATAPTWWVGSVGAAAILGAGALFVRHCVRRFGGLVGDVLGALIELTTAAVLVLCLTVSR